MATGLRWTEEELARFQIVKKLPSVSPIAAVDPAFSRESRNKFNNVVCEADKIKFPSKKHREHYLLLKAMQQAGEILFFLREVPFDLIGHYENGRVVRHYVDFMLCRPDGTFRYQEVKGKDLPVGKLKRIQVEELYGIRIEVV